MIELCKRVVFPKERSYSEFLYLFLQAENTFLLTLDGDVDFKPDAVKLLIDRMKKNRKVGAVCGRIHPIGSGKNKSPYAQITQNVTCFYFLF